MVCPWPTWLSCSLCTYVMKLKFSYKINTTIYIIYIFFYITNYWLNFTFKNYFCKICVKKITHKKNTACIYCVAISTNIFIVRRRRRKKEEEQIVCVTKLTKADKCDFKNYIYGNFTWKKRLYIVCCLLNKLSFVGIVFFFFSSLWYIVNTRPNTKKNVPRKQNIHIHKKHKKNICAAYLKCVLQFLILSLTLSSFENKAI